MHYVGLSFAKHPPDLAFTQANSKGQHVNFHMIFCTGNHQLIVNFSHIEPFHFGEAVVIIEPWDTGVQWSSRVDGRLEMFAALPDPGLPFSLLAQERGAAAWLARIPEAFVQPVLAYEEEHQTNAFPLLWFLSRSERARDLFASQPSLVWLILESAREADWPTDRVLALFGEKRAKIVNVCIQGQKATLKTLTKIQSTRWGRREFELLKALPTLPHAAALNHLRVLDFRLLEFLVHFPKLIGCRLLAPYQTDWPCWARFSELVGDTLLVATHLGLRNIFERIGACGTVQDLAQLHNRLVFRLNQVELERAPLVEYPPPPLLGTPGIIPITNSKDLVLEGKTQHLCVGSYHRAICGGRYYVYRIMKPERATLGLRIGYYGTLQIEQLKLSYNQPPSPETWIQVEDWLQCSQKIMPTYHATYNCLLFRS